MTSMAPEPASKGITGEKWDRNYSVPEYVFGTAPNAFLVAKATMIPAGTRVLVPGDGEGRNGVWLATQGFRVSTVDASAVGVSKARALAADQSKSLAIEHADLETWNWPEAQFDAVVAIFVHMYPDVRTRLHARMARALTPNGLLILEAFAKSQIGRRKAGSKGGPPPEMLYDVADLRRDFEGLDILELCEVEITLAEGSRHQGAASVVRLVARRR